MEFAKSVLGNSSPQSVPLLATTSNLLTRLVDDPLKLPHLVSSYAEAYAPTYVVDRLPRVLPFSPFTLIHATRLAYLYHDTIKAQGYTVGSRRGQVGYVQAVSVCVGLVFFGTTCAATLQGQPSPLLSAGSGEVALAYASACVGMATAYPVMAALLPKEVLTLLFIVIDAVACTLGTLTLGLTPVLLAASPSPPLVIPSLLIPVLSLFAPRVAFTHPSYFMRPHTLFDVWGCLAITLVYGGIVNGTGPFELVRHGLQLSTSTAAEAAKQTPAGAPMMLPQEAQALCAFILIGIFAVVEYAPRIAPQQHNKLSNSMSSSKPLSADAGSGTPRRQTEIEKLIMDNRELSPLAVFNDGSSVGDAGDLIGGRALRKRKPKKVKADA